MTSAIDGVAPPPGTSEVALPVSEMQPENQAGESEPAGVADGDRFRLVLSEVETYSDVGPQVQRGEFGERIQGLLDMEGVRSAQMRDVLEAISDGEFTRAAEEASARADQIVDIASSQSFESPAAYQSNLQQARSEAGMIRMEGNLQSHADMIGAQTGLTLQIAMMTFVKNVSTMAVQGFNKVISGR